MEVKSVQYVGGRTPNAFQNNPVDFLAGVRIYPRSWFGFSAAYRAHMNQQGGRIFNDRGPEDFPRGFVLSQDPHGYLFQFWAGRRNERAPTVVPNNPPTTAVSASPVASGLSLQIAATNERPSKAVWRLAVRFNSRLTRPTLTRDTLLYTCVNPGGRLTGDGAQRDGDLSGVQPGTYTASVEVDAGLRCTRVLFDHGDG